jgi:hypothetical protein
VARQAIAAKHIDDYREPIPGFRFLESLLCHRYTSCPILRPCSKLDMELHMAAMAALGGRIGQRSALLLWCSWLANFSSGCQSGNKNCGDISHAGAPARAPPALHQRHSTSSDLIFSRTRSSIASLSTIMNGVRERFDSPRGYRQNAGQN